MNVGIVGYGAIAREHALALHRIRKEPDGRNVSLTGVMGRLLEPACAFAEEFGAALATTDLGRAPRRAASRGGHRLLAHRSARGADGARPARRQARPLRDPLATSLAETDQLIGLAEQAGLRLMVCHTQRYAAPLVEARRMIADGEVRPRAMVSRYLLDKRENVSWTGRRRSWTDNLLWHHGCHAVDAALWLLGTEAIDVTARATPPDPRLGIPMDLSILLRTAHEQVVTVVMSYRALPPVQDYLIIADETTLVYADDVLRDHARVLVSAADHGATTPRRSIARTSISSPRLSAEASRSPAPALVRPAMAALQAAQDELDRRETRPGSESASSESAHALAVRTSRSRQHGNPDTECRPWRQWWPRYLLIQLLTSDIKRLR